MGYRLEIKEKELSVYASKLYGYVDEERELLSYKYLVNIGKLNDILLDGLLDVPCFGYGIEPIITLTTDEFKIFMLCYMYDLRKERGKNYFELLNEDELSIFYKIWNSSGNKIITWW